jgi:hypothetical protein
MRKWLGVRLTIAGAVRDAPVRARRERASLLCARVALDAPARGRSASPLGGIVKKSALPFLLALLVARWALADVEGMLSLGTFRLECPGLDDSGPVIITGSQSREGLKALTVAAFGKQFSLTLEQLRELHAAASFNGVQLSYSHGYKGFGSRTIYILLTSGFTSHVVSRQLVEVSEERQIRVRPPPRQQ